MKLANFSQWASLWDYWFKDHLYMRQDFLSAYQIIWERYLGSPRLQYLVYKNESFPSGSWAPVVESYLGMKPLSKEELTAFKQGIAGMAAFLSIYDIPYALIIAPDKTTCYPEKLPFWTRWKRGLSSYEQLNAAITTSGVKHIDITNILLEEKRNRRVYNLYNDTTHWNGNALDIAYKAIWKSLKPYLDNPDDALFEGSYSITISTTKETGFIQDRVPFIALKPFTELKSKSEEMPFLPRPYQTWGQPRFFENSSVKTGYVIFVSDSIFLACSGASLTPFPHVLNRYGHFLNEKLSLSFFERLFATTGKPNMFIESFAERMHAHALRERALLDPRVRVLGDSFLRTPGYLLSPEIFLGEGAPSCSSSFNAANVSEVTWKGKSPIITFAPVVSDEDGRVFVAFRIKSKQATVVKLYHSLEKGKFLPPNFVAAQVPQGESLIHMQVFRNPGEVIHLRLAFDNREGIYTFLSMPEADKVRLKNIKK